MPTRVDSGRTILGFDFEVSKPDGTPETVRYTKGFLTSAHGQTALSVLETAFHLLLQDYPTEIADHPEMIDTILALIPQDDAWTVYVNELNLMATAVKGWEAKPGDLGKQLTTDDLQDYTALEIGVEIPPDQGFIFIFTAPNKRKGIYWDLAPLSDPFDPRKEDLSTTFARNFGFLSHIERFMLDDPSWERLFSQQIFLFGGLKDSTIRLLAQRAHASLDLAGCTTQIIQDVRDRTSVFLEIWRKTPAFQDHMPVLTHAIDEFNVGDYMSCCALLWPRIEGLLRSQRGLQVTAPLALRPTHKEVVEQGLPDEGKTVLAYFLRDRFEQYLKEVVLGSYYPPANSPVDPTATIGRHVMTHGVLHPAGFSEKNSALGILIVQQLALLFDS